VLLLLGLPSGLFLSFKLQPVALDSFFEALFLQLPKANSAEQIAAINTARLVCIIIRVISGTNIVFQGYNMWATILFLSATLALAIYFVVLTLFLFFCTIDG
jgi:hypothetical protein